MRTNHLTSNFWCSIAAASLVLTPALVAHAQNAASSAPQTAQPKLGEDAINAASNRAKAYYHAALADIYEEEAVNSGQPEYVTHAIEEYKDALNADPTSPQLNDALADLYFRTP